MPHVLQPLARPCSDGHARLEERRVEGPEPKVVRERPLANGVVVLTTLEGEGREILLESCEDVIERRALRRSPAEPDTAPVKLGRRHEQPRHRRRRQRHDEALAQRDGFRGGHHALVAHLKRA